MLDKHTSRHPNGVIRKDIGQDPLKSLRDLRDKFNDINNDHREAIYRWMEETFPVMKFFFRNSDAFDKLCEDEFWATTRKKPNRKARARFILYYITEAVTKNAREKASRKALILRMFLKEKRRADEIAEVITAIGGISKAYGKAKAFFSAENAGVASQPNSPRSSTDDDDGNEDNADYEGSGRDTENPDEDGGHQPGKPNAGFPVKLTIHASEKHSYRLFDAKTATVLMRISGSSKWKDIVIERVMSCTN